jgi:hypothetical protein
MGNIKDSKLELPADKGNGHYAYIESTNNLEASVGLRAGAGRDT